MQRHCQRRPFGQHAGGVVEQQLVGRRDGGSFLLLFPIQRLAQPPEGKANA